MDFNTLNLVCNAASLVILSILMVHLIQTNLRIRNQQLRHYKATLYAVEKLERALKEIEHER